MGLNCRAENLGKCPLLGLGSWLLALDIITMTPTERQNPSECTQSPLSYIEPGILQGDPPETPIDQLFGITLSSQATKFCSVL